MAMFELEGKKQESLVVRLGIPAVYGGVDVKVSSSPMPARSLSCLTPEQLSALAEIGIASGDVVDTSCTSPDLNTCQRDANELLSQYPLYDPGHGVYTAWGEIPLPWEHEDLVSDERWQVAEYTDEFGYREGDQVLVIGNDGLLVTLYTAVSDTPAPAGPFDPDLWSEVCHVTTSVPVGLPDINSVLSKYPFYNPSEFLTRWEEFDSEWSEDLIDPSSDKWDEARIDKEFFYQVGDIVLYNTSCNDYTCVYICTVDMPSDPELVAPGPPPVEYFSRLYCIGNNNTNTCNRQVVCGPGRTIVSLSEGDNDLICVPSPVES